jgi:hypothetical protein
MINCARQPQKADGRKLGLMCGANIVMPDLARRSIG